MFSVFSTDLYRSKLRFFESILIGENSRLKKLPLIKGLMIFYNLKLMILKRKIHATNSIKFKYNCFKSTRYVLVFEHL